jgi:hypothetical protein
MDAKVVPFDELAEADLVIDAVYRGGVANNAADEPLHKLTRCGTWEDVSLEGYREEFDPGYEEAEEEYDYFARPQEVRDAVGRVQNTGAIGKPMITLHGTLDALLPLLRRLSRQAAPHLGLLPGGI